MRRVTRRSARSQVSPSTTSGTGTTNVSPIFSTPVSIKETETPPTSDVDEPTKKRTTRARSTTRRKRAPSSDLDASEPEEAPTKRPAAKRRAVANRAYVEIPYKLVKGKTHAGVSLSPLELPNRNLESSKATRNKGKGRAPVVEESDAQSEPGLEYDEDPLLEESDDSGSEFVDSDEDQDFAPEDNSEAEAFMLDAAIRMSFETSRNLASSSATQLVSVNPEAVLRAAAAERRLTRANKDIDVDDYQIPPSDSESDEPLSAKSKNGTKKNAKKGVQVHDTTKKKHMTLAQLRKAKNEERRKNNEARRELKAGEKALRIELGRPLTYVSLFVG